jgi:hypothetical protein
VEEERKPMEAGVFSCSGELLGPPAAQREEEGRTRSPTEQEEEEEDSFPCCVCLACYREVPPGMRCALLDPSLFPCLCQCCVVLVVDPYFGTRRGCFCMLLPSTSYPSQLSSSPRMDGWMASQTCSKEGKDHICCVS